MSIYYVGYVPYSAELYHYGVKGMKWGIRKSRDRTYAHLSKKDNNSEYRYDLRKKKSAKSLVRAYAGIGLTMAIKHYGSRYLLWTGHDTAAMFLDLFGNIPVGIAIGNAVNETVKYKKNKNSD